MTDRRRGRRGRRGRWLAGGLIGAGLVLLVASGMLVAASLAEGEEAGSGTPVAAIEQMIRRDERLHYEIHQSLGRLLYLCPCTRGKASVQFSKAAYHVPEDVRFRRELTTRFPEAPRQVGALLACQDAVRARLRAGGLDVTFPAPTGMARGDLEDAVFDGGAGILSVSQPVRTWPAGERALAAQDDSASFTIYTCDARPAPVGGWVVDRLDVLS